MTREIPKALLASSLMVFFGSFSAIVAQQPTPTPTPRAGRSYSVGELPKTPPSPGPKAPSPVTFSDVTRLSRIAFVHAGSPTSQKYLLETMGGGVAIFDYDNDGRMDLFFTNGAALRDPMSKDEQPDKREPKFWNRLYQQKGDGSFIDVTERAGLKGEGFSMGVAAADYDNDGYVDLYVTGYGENHLYHNNGNGTFSELRRSLVSWAAVGPPAPAGSTTIATGGSICSWRVISNGISRKGQSSVGTSRGTRAYCHPENFQGADQYSLSPESGWNF